MNVVNNRNVVDIRLKLTNQAANELITESQPSSMFTQKKPLYNGLKKFSIFYSFFVKFKKIITTNEPSDEKELQNKEYHSKYCFCKVIFL